MMTANLAKVHSNQRMTVMSNPTVNSVFEAFIEADKAMKELPAIREELAQAKADQANLQQHANHLQEDLENWRAEAAALKASLAAREAELAHATFRADAVEAKHRALRSILGGGDSSVVAVDGALTDDHAQAAADHSEVFWPSNPQSPGPTGLPSSESGLESSGQSVLVPTSPSSGDATSAASPDTAVTGQSDLDPTSPTPATNGTSPAPQPENPTSAPGHISNPSNEGSVSVNPTLDPSGKNPASSVADLASTASVTSLQGSDTSLAFAGQPSARKPDGMEWGYWIVNGGEAPLWMSTYQEERLRQEFAQYAGHAKAAAE